MDQNSFKHNISYDIGKLLPYTYIYIYDINFKFITKFPLFSFQKEFIKNYIIKLKFWFEVRYNIVTY